MTQPKVTVYTKPACVQCEQTKKYLDKHNLAYETIDVSVDEKALEYITGLGYMAAPVVTFGENHWSGFRLDKLASIHN
jgi:glutaredoxin-like protein NrdH